MLKSITSFIIILIIGLVLSLADIPGPARDYTGLTEPDIAINFRAVYAPDKPIPHKISRKRLTK